MGQQAMGSFLHRWRKEKYFFSIRSGLERGLPLDDSCPSLRAVLHASELKNAAFLTTSVSYERETSGIMAVGMCARALASGTIPAREASLCQHAAYQEGELLTRPDDLPRSPW